MRLRFSTLSLMVAIAASALPMFLLIKVLEKTFGDNRREIVRLTALAETYEAEARERREELDELGRSGFADNAEFQSLSNASYRRQRMSDLGWDHSAKDAFVLILPFVIPTWISPGLFGAYLVAAIEGHPRRQARQWNAPTSACPCSRYLLSFY